MRPLVRETTGYESMRGLKRRRGAGAPENNRHEEDRLLFNVAERDADVVCKPHGRMIDKPVAHRGEPGSAPVNIGRASACSGPTIPTYP